VREYFIQGYLVALIAKQNPQYLRKNEKGKIFYIMWMCLFVRRRELHVCYKAYVWEIKIEIRKRKGKKRCIKHI
jgi:hypothetical protein